MPPQHSRDAHVENIGLTVTQANTTRELLRSLEELRDSLSFRVNQLATAVERLRVQAGQLQNSVIGSPTRRSFSGRLQPPDMNQPRSDTFTTTSAIASEAAQLDHPITTSEIYRLLDRASASLVEAQDISSGNMDDRMNRPSEVQIGGESRSTPQGDRASRITESQSRLRQRIMTRWERVAAPTGGSGPIGESAEDEARRRLAEITQEGDERRASGGGHVKRERFVRRQRASKTTQIGLPATNTPSANPIIVQTEGVSPPPPRVRTHPRARSSISIAPLPTVPTSTSPTPIATTSTRLAHLDAASLDELHTQIADLDLNLEPAAYMSGLSRIIRRAISPASGDTPSPLSAESSSSTSSDSTAIGENNDGLTYRGRDVQDRIRTATPDLGGLLGEDDPAVRGIHDRVVAMMGGPSREDRIREIDAINRNRLEEVRRQRIERAREIVLDSNRSVHDAARSARELVNAATNHTDEQPNQAERDAAYERTVQAELRRAQTDRTRAYNYYQRIVAARARRPHSPSLDLSTPQQRLERTTRTSPPSPTPNEDIYGPQEEDAARQFFISTQMREAAVQQRLLWARSRLRRETPADAGGPGGSERAGRRETGNRQFGELNTELLPYAPYVGTGPMVERTEQGSWIERDLPGTMRLNTPPRLRPWGSSRTVGPRDERPEEVDTMVRIRQLQRQSPPTSQDPPTPEMQDEDEQLYRRVGAVIPERARLSAPERDRLIARRSHLVQIRHELSESRRRIRESSTDTGEDDSLRQLILDARQVNEARQSLYDNLEGNDWGVTPSSPITATGNGDYSHIQISVGTSTASDIPDVVWTGGGAQDLVQDFLGELEDVEAIVEGDDGLEPDLEEPRVGVSGGEDAVVEKVQDGDRWPSGKLKRRERPYISLLDL